MLAVAGRRPVRSLAPWPEGHRWAALLTHDLDVVDWWGLFPLLRMAELATKGDWICPHESARAAMRSVGRDPVSLGSTLHPPARGPPCDPGHLVRHLSPSPPFRSMLAGDSTYRPEGPPRAGSSTALTHAGHEIGLHGSFATARSQAHDRRSVGRSAVWLPIPGDGRAPALPPNATRTSLSESWLRLVSTTMPPGGLPIETGSVWEWRMWFRPGTQVREATLPLDLVPLIWMDRALSKYAGVEEPGRWIEDARELAGECKAVEGAWVGLWHPNTTEALGISRRRARLREPASVAGR